MQICRRGKPSCPCELPHFNHGQPVQVKIIDVEKMMKPVPLQSLIKLFFIVMTLLMSTGAVYPQADPGVLRNPLNPSRGPDPWLVYYEGNYYLATTTGTSELVMRQSPTLAGLKTADPIQIYFETDPSRCCNMWAPEFY